jgi:hypothetical protein
VENCAAYKTLLQIYLIALASSNVIFLIKKSVNHFPANIFVIYLEDTKPMEIFFFRFEAGPATVHHIYLAHFHKH